MIFIITYLAVGMITTGSLSAGCITSEKEAGTWPGLMTTPLEEGQILMGKALGVFRRCLPIWILMFTHIMVFTFAGYIHPAAILQLILPAQILDPAARPVIPSS